MRHLKSIALAAAVVTLAGQAVAGGFAPVVIDPTPVVVIEPPMAARSSFGLILPIVLLGGLVALAVSAEGDDDDNGGDTGGTPGG